MVEHKWIKESLIAFKKVMGKNGIPFWLEYGTQLGAVRDGEIIPWDLDGDVGVWLKDIPRMKDAEQDFRANGMYIAFQPGHAFLNYMVAKEKKVYLATLDIYTFTFKEYKKKVWLVRIENGETYDVRSPGRYYLTFRIIKLFGELFHVPTEAEKALEFAYGKEWRTPIKKAGVSIQIGKLTPRQLNKGGRTHHKKLEDL